MEKHIKGLAILAIGLCLVTCPRCGKESTRSTSSHPIVGEWSWVESWGGFAGEHRTPETEGYTKTYVFRADHTFLQYRNDSLCVSEEYRITEKVVWQKERAKVLEIEGMIDQIIEFEGDDTLTLIGHGEDCFSEVFVRIGSK